MLRILGWNNRYIIIVTILKSLFYHIIPGATIGLLFASYITLNLRRIIKDHAKISMELEFDTNAIIVGILCALLLPLVSMIEPLYKASRQELRDALDVYRRKADDVSVQFTKLESMYGLSMSQLIIGVLFTSYGVIAFVLIPTALVLEKSSGKAFFWLMTIFGALVVGITGVAQLILPIAAKEIV